VTKLFNNILVPVFTPEELNINTEKAIELARRLQSNIHLLFLAKRQKHAVIRKAAHFFARRKKVNKSPDLLEVYERKLLKLHPSVTFEYAIAGENLNHSIVAYANRNNIDLILILDNGSYAAVGQNKNLNIERLSENLSLPILAVHLKSNIGAIKDIVVPVESFVPMKKLVVASYIGKIFNSKIHLVSLSKRYLINGRDEAVCLYKAYHLLHDNTNLNVECVTLTARNIKEATMRYATRIDADIVLVNSKVQSHNPELMN
jgi:hypothetical protein